MKHVNNEVIYQIYPLTFNYAPGSACDPYKGAYGNLKGITAAVDYVASLGVDAIWITPFYPWSGMGFGYDITDYCAVAPLFGTIEDFKEICDTYHAKGIKVIIDQVYNHCASTHPWFQKSIKREAPYEDYFIWADPKGFTEDGEAIMPNNWESIWNSDGPSAWTYNKERKQCYMHSFDCSMPNLNINNPLVQEELLKIAKFWFDLGVDGFRLDAAAHYAACLDLTDNPVDTAGRIITIYDKNTETGLKFLNRLKALCNSYPVPKTLLAEYSYDQSDIGCQIAADIMQRSSCDAFFTGALNGVLFEFKKKITTDLHVCPNGEKLNWAMSCHDTERAATRLFKEDYSPAKMSMLMNLLTTLPGSICIFQGDELGLPNPKSMEVCKNPENDPLSMWTNFNMPWDAGRAGFAFSDAPDDISRNFALHPDEEHYKYAVSNQENVEGSTLELTKKYIQKRKNGIFSRSGHVKFLRYVKNPEIIAFIRSFKNNRMRVLCIYNFSNEEVTVTYKGQAYTLSPESWLHTLVHSTPKKK